MPSGPPYHAWTHTPHKYGDGTLRGGTDPMDGVLYLPSAAETDGQVLTRRSTGTHGIAWETASSGSGMDPKYVPPSHIYLPVLELAFESNTLWASATPTWTIDSGYPHNGYMQMNADAAYIAWPIVFGPRGSQWLPIPVLATGPDHGIVKLEIGTAEYDDDGNGWPGTFEAYSNVATFVTVQTMDRYSASLNKFPGSSQIANTFQVTGVDGAVGTSYTSFQWNGGSGPAFVRLRVDGKNASSSGFKFHLSSFVFSRVDNFLLV